MPVRYELLLRFHESTGAFKGAHARYSDGSIMPITPETLGDWLPQALTDALATNQALTAERDALVIERDTAITDLATRTAERDAQTQTVRWDGAQWVVEAIPIEQMQAQVGAAVQSMIDAVCTSGVPYFRDIFSARGYVNDPNPAYHARAVALRDWSSSVWTTLDEIQADVMAGNRQLPTLTELLAELPQPPA